MKINKISINYSIPQRVQNSTENKNSAPKNKTFGLKLSQIPSDNLKANFLPSFGNLKKVGETTIFDRNTGNEVRATVKKDCFFGEYLEYDLYVGKKRVGFMRMKKHSDLPEDAYLLTSQKPPYETFPEITHLRTIEGDKYSKIGTALINIAIDESIKQGTEGALWLKAEKGYEKELSPYRSNENPIPFYYKMGFRAIGDKDRQIKEKLAQGEEGQQSLPNSSLLVLTPKAAKKFKAKHQF